MTYRSLSGILVVIAVVVELYFFMNAPDPTKTEQTGLGKWIGSRVVVDYEAKQSREQKYMILIGATVIAGGVLTFSLPNRKIELKEYEDRNEEV